MTHRVKLNNGQWSVGNADCTRSEAYDFILHGTAGSKEWIADRIINSIARKAK